MPLPEDTILVLSRINAAIPQVVEWLAKAYHVAVFDHRVLTTTGLALWAFVPQVPFKIIQLFVWTAPKAVLVAIVRCFGFGATGIEKDSFASRYQSEYYGGRIEPDSLFSCYQSVGASQKGYGFKCDDSAYWGYLGFGLLVLAFLTWAGYLPDSL